MLYLFLAIASSAMVSICMRASEKHIKNEMGMFMANYAICILLSAWFMDWHANLFRIINKVTIFPVAGLGIISGILYLAGFVFLKINMKHNGVVMAATFMKLGVLVPILIAVVLYHEVPKGTQIFGIILSVIAIIIIHFEKDALQESNRKLWLIGLLLLSGITDSMANIFEKTGVTEGKDIYLLITFFVAFLIALICSLSGKGKLHRNDLFFGALIGIPNYFSARFLLLALSEVAAVLVYPIYSVATIVVITLVGVFAFHESLSRKKVLAMAMIILALCLLNI